MIRLKTPLENIEGKVENAGNQHFLLFSQCFLLFPEQFLNFQSHLFCRLQMLRTLIQSRILVFGKELMHPLDPLYQANVHIMLDP